MVMKRNIKKVLEVCEKNNLRITKPRLKVLNIIFSSHKPIKAYEILDQLGKEMINPKPPTAYRAIDFWLKHNFIHRIESLNAYYACNADHLHNGSQFLICKDCGEVTESHKFELPNNLKKTIKENSFLPTRWNLEVNGVCRKCA